MSMLFQLRVCAIKSGVTISVFYRVNKDMVQAAKVVTIGVQRCCVRSVCVCVCVCDTITTCSLVNWMFSVSGVVELHCLLSRSIN